MKANFLFSFSLQWLITKKQHPFFTATCLCESLKICFLAWYVSTLDTQVPKMYLCCRQHFRKFYVPYQHSITMVPAYHNFCPKNSYPTKTCCHLCLQVLPARMAVRSDYGAARKYGTVCIHIGQKVRYASMVGLRNICLSASAVRWYAIEMCGPNVLTYGTEMAIFRVSKRRIIQKYQ